jgi:hypothetical protein
MVRGGGGGVLGGGLVPLLSKGGLRGQQKVAPGGKRVAYKKPTIVLVILRCLLNPTVARQKTQIKFVELN